jgi:hypothetical protein
MVSMGISYKKRRMLSKVHNKIMGRAQGRVKDSFTNVLGERRGLQTFQKNDATAPPAHVAREFLYRIGISPDISERIFSLTHWLIVESTKIRETKGKDTKVSFSPPFLAEQITFYRRLSSNSEAELECTGDLDFLVSQGICFKSNNSRNSRSYSIKRPSSWSDEQREEYYTWYDYTFEYQE